jgi:multiple sugar transport system permease protein
MYKKRTIGQSILLYSFEVIVVIFVLAPPIWLFISSISTQAQLLDLPLKWIPRRPTLERYIKIFTAHDDSPEAVFRRALLNSFIISAGVAFISVFLGGLAAYAFTRLTFWGNKSILFTLLFTYMLPPIMVVLPLYTLFRNLGMLDTLGCLILTYTACIMPFGIWTLRGYFQGLPKSLEDAARIDGCSRLGTFFRIVLPVALPGLAATSLLSFILSWEEFLIALVFTSTPASKTITVAITEFQGRHTLDYPLMATGGVIAAAVPVMVSVFFQKWLISGLTAGSVKG